MPRFERERPKRLFQGAEFGRLMTMICMFVVLVMMIKTASNPDVWKWLVGKPGQKIEVVGQDQAEDSKAVPKSNDVASGGKQDKPPAKKISAATGPTDESDFEALAAKQEYDSVSDGSQFVQIEDNPIYERITRWVINQPYERLLARAVQNNPPYGQFIGAPNDFRKAGKIFAFDAHILQVIKYDGKQTFTDEFDPHEPATLYEMVGTTDESRGRFFQFVVYDPPAGLPVGRGVNEDVRFVGYFFRIQAYEPGNAKLNSPLLLAPCFIGRIDWKPRGQGVLVKSSEIPWLILVAGIAIVALAIWLGIVFFGKQTRSLAEVATSLPPPPSAIVEEWLDQVESTEPGEHDSNGTVMTEGPERGAPYHNGHSHGNA